MAKRNRLPARPCVMCSTEFQPYVANQVTCSRPCRDRQSHIVARIRAYERTPEGRAQQRENQRRQALRPERRAQWFASNLRRYGLTVEQWQAMVTAQDNRCAICGNPPNPGTGPATKRLHVDHDHVTGRNRDLLCNTCNYGIGQFKDDPALLRAAADYIDRHREGSSLCGSR